MTFSVHGLPVARGIAIGRAVLMASSRVDVAHYFIDPTQVESEITRVRVGRNAVVEEIHRLQQTIAAMGPKEAPHELAALLDVHLMLLQDEELISGVKHWISDRLYNAEWALTTSSRCWRASSTTWRTNTCASARPTSSRSPSGSCAT